jgi:hypothetical protein
MIFTAHDYYVIPYSNEGWGDSRDQIVDFGDSVIAEYRPADTVCETYSNELDSKLIFSLAPATTNRPAVTAREWLAFPEDYTIEQCVQEMLEAGLRSAAFTLNTALLMEGKTFAEIKADATMSAAWSDLYEWWHADPNDELCLFLIEHSVPVAFSKEFSRLFLKNARPLDRAVVSYNGEIVACIEQGKNISLHTGGKVLEGDIVISFPDEL